MIYGIIHATGAATFGFALYYEFVHLHLPGHVVRTPSIIAMSKFPGKWKYLTVWNLVLQFAYHTYSLVNDLKGSSELNPKHQTVMQKVRDTFFASWIFPAGTFVSVAFWSLYAYDPRFMFSSVVGDSIPSWLNHALHTAPIFFVTINMMVVPKTYPERTVGLPLLLFGTVTYLLWVSWVAYKTGVWAYPILEILDNTSRVAFFGTSAASILGLYFAGEKFQKWRWGANSIAEGSSPGGSSKPSAASVGKSKKN